MGKGQQVIESMKVSAENFRKVVALTSAMGDEDDADVASKVEELMGKQIKENLRMQRPATFGLIYIPQAFEKLREGDSSNQINYQDYVEAINTVENFDIAAFAADLKSKSSKSSMIVSSAANRNEFIPQVIGTMDRVQLMGFHNAINNSDLKVKMKAKYAADVLGMLGNAIDKADEAY